MSKQSLKSAVIKYQTGTIDRRTFLVSAGVLTGGIALGSLLSYFYKVSGSASALDSEQDRLIRAIQNHLFPTTENAPGARDINALEYLHFVLLDKNIDQDNKALIVNGIGWLEERSVSELNRSFSDLSIDDKENILRTIEFESWGERWLSMILLYIFEALLSDPLYGGNPDGIGWKWLNHDPGLPRPTKNKIYGKL
jgi:gluconate 2-dehydrogenase gamma chain